MILCHSNRLSGTALALCLMAPCNPASSDPLLLSLEMASSSLLACSSGRATGCYENPSWGFVPFGEVCMRNRHSLLRATDVPLLERSLDVLFSSPSLRAIMFVASHCSFIFRRT